MNEQLPQSVHPENFVRAMSIVILDGNRFHVFRGGENALMLICHTDLVVRAEFAALLARLCPAQLDVSPAVIAQIATGETWPGYCVLRRLPPITPENIEQLEANGNRVWAFDDHHLFVSPAVAGALRDAFPGQLRFSSGFTGYG